MSVNNLKKYLINNEQVIIKILEQTDFYSISFSNYRNEIRCSYHEGGNPTSVSVNCENLCACIFSQGFQGDLIGLIQFHNNWSFKYTLDFLYKITKVDKSKEIDSPYIFNGLYLNKRKKNILNKYETYSSDILNNFLNYPNQRFLEDNISLETQIKFNIKYDNINNRIVVPWLDKKGNIVGLTGRYNFDELGNNPKWKAIQPFKKGSFLYGIYENYDDIKKNEYVIIGESEKFVLQLDTYGYHNALALGSCNISHIQANIIKTLPVNKVILALDEGVPLEHLIKECNKLKGGIFTNNKDIYSIYDMNNSLLPYGSKMSPSDIGKSKFKELLESRCYKKE